MEREWLDLRALTEYASVSERTLREWIARRKDALPAYRVGKKILVKRSEFDAWVSKHVLNSLDAIDVDQLVGDLLNNVREAT